MLLSREDPNASDIASILSQAAVPSRYAGAAIVTATGTLLIEGRAGEGDALMKGEVAPEELPGAIVSDVTDLYRRAHRTFGPVRFEWVHDGSDAWLVQLHRGVTESDASIIVPGTAAVWTHFDVAEGLASLRDVLRTLDDDSGLILRGAIGLTSHIADVIRRAGKPARIEPIGRGV